MPFLPDVTFLGVEHRELMSAAFANLLIVDEKHAEACSARTGLVRTGFRRNTPWVIYG